MHHLRRSIRCFIWWGVLTWLVGSIVPASFPFLRISGENLQFVTLGFACLSFLGFYGLYQFVAAREGEGPKVLRCHGVLLTGGLYCLLCWWAYFTWDGESEWYALGHFARTLVEMAAILGVVACLRGFCQQFDLNRAGLLVMICGCLYVLSRMLQDFGDALPLYQTLELTHPLALYSAIWLASWPTGLAFLIAMAAAVRKILDAADGRCWGCGYRLFGTPSLRCSECGARLCQVPT